MIDADYIATANRILQEDGYLVCAFAAGPAPIPKIGDVVPHSIQDIPGPFAVVGHATREEFIAQAARYASDWWMASVVTPRADVAIAFFKLAAE